ncbi:RraA family protein [Kitasatospora sp. NBC_00240]|uniref:RraA family protein n=1 Tax=Kitasatospora sp. NBC_00240 TaxID=2903567 RepID=UPI0022557B28|nr:RraA family protein [Kitasatospora sp. NBC_00240]MCX5212301.1 RraA family protein [Kitasatospora sp. NBC_00240]
MSDRSPAVQTSVQSALSALSTAHLADACVRLGVQVRCGPSGLTAVAGGMRCAGGVLPVRHVGSVDIFFEALERSRPGDVLVIDNGGRLDEACIGDLAVLEVQQAGLAGIVVWGLHRDTRDLLRIGLPVFTLGATPAGPLQVGERLPDGLERARVGPWAVTAADVAVGDGDGVVFLPGDRMREIVAAAEAIRDVEERQADAMRAGSSLRRQTGFADYLAARGANPGLTFREHLRATGGAIEE